MSSNGGNTHINIGAQSFQWCNRIIAQRFSDHHAAVGEIAIQNLERERLFGYKVSAKGSLRHTRGLNNIAHAGTHITALEHHLESVRQYPVFIGNFAHSAILRSYIVTVNRL